MMSQSNNINNNKKFTENGRKLNDILKREGYMSLEIIARGYKVDPQWAFQRWLSEPTSLEYIQLWERLHNPDFLNEKYISLCNNALGDGSFPTLEELKLECRIKSIYVDLNFQEEIYLHKDVACDFACWISPAFRVYCLKKLSLSMHEQPLQFVSEEDFIVSKTTVAQLVKKEALEKYISNTRLCNFATNETPEYKYSVKAKLKIEN